MQSTLYSMARAAEFGVGLLFVHAAIRKWLYPERLRTILIALDLKRVAAVASFIPTVELILGVCLLFDLRPAITLPVTAGILVIFTAAIVRLEGLGMEDDCGCFGDRVRLSFRIRPRTRNALLLLVVGGCMGVRQNWEWEWETGHVRLTIGVTAAVMVVAANLLAAIRQGKALSQQWESPLSGEPLTRKE